MLQFLVNDRISFTPKERNHSTDTTSCRQTLLYCKVAYMKLFVRPVDMTSVNTIVYHLPDGPTLSLNVGGIEEFVDLELEQGHYCDTSDIDGILHFFPRGNA